MNLNYKFFLNSTLAIIIIFSPACGNVQDANSENILRRFLRNRSRPSEEVTSPQSNQRSPIVDQSEDSQPSIVPSIGEQVNPQITDSQINDWLDPHYVISPSASTRHRLFLFLPGSYGEPSRQTLITQQAAELGYHAINLNYPNSWTVGGLCKRSRDPDCAGNLRKEIIQGQDTSPEVQVGRANSIENRLIKLLQYLERKHPEQGWDQYLSGDSVPWNLLIVAGHSQGGGHAAMIGKLHQVERVVMLGAPSDISRSLRALAPWLSMSGATPPERYFGFAHEKDPGIEHIKKAWEVLGMPSYGPIINVDKEAVPYKGSHQLTTSMEPKTSGGKYDEHGSVATDSKTPLSSDGSPVFKKVWQYLINGK